MRNVEEWTGWIWLRIGTDGYSFYCCNEPSGSIKCGEIPDYRGADKSLVRPGRKQATATEDFDVNISYLLS